MTTTLDHIDVKYVIKVTDTNTYASNTVHLTVSNTNGKSLVTTSTVTQPDGTTDGSVVFSDVPLQLGNNSIKMELANNTDLDSATVLIKLGSAQVRYIGNSPTYVEV